MPIEDVDEVLKGTIFWISDCLRVSDDFVRRTGVGLVARRTGSQMRYLIEDTREMA